MTESAQKRRTARSDELRAVLRIPVHEGGPRDFILHTRHRDATRWRSVNWRLGREVRKYSQARGHVLSVLVFIAECTDPDGTNAWPAVATIAAHCGISERTVQRALRELEASGELWITPRTDEVARVYSRRPNCYAVTFPQIRRGDNLSPRGDNLTPDLYRYYLSRGFAANDPAGVAPSASNSRLGPGVGMS